MKKKSQQAKLNTTSPKTAKQQINELIGPLKELFREHNVGIKKRGEKR